MFLFSLPLSPSWSRKCYICAMVKRPYSCHGKSWHIIGIWYKSLRTWMADIELLILMVISSNCWLVNVGECWWYIHKTFSWKPTSSWLNMFKPSIFDVFWTQTPSIQTRSRSSSPVLPGIAPGLYQAVFHQESDLRASMSWKMRLVHGLWWLILMIMNQIMMVNDG